MRLKILAFQIFVFLKSSLAIDTTLDVTINFESSGMAVLSQLLGDQTYNDVLDHGCHCSKLDPFSNAKILGGVTELDGLDAICRQWILTRNCIDFLAGGSCKDVDKDNNVYTIQWSSQDSTIAECSVQDGSFQQCKTDACAVDLHFAYQVVDYLRFWAAESFST